MSQKQWFVDGQNIKTFIWCCKSFLQCSNRKKTLMEIKQAHISYEAKPRGLNFVRFVLLVQLCFLFRLKLLLPLDLFLPVHWTFWHFCYHWKIWNFCCHYKFCCQWNFCYLWNFCCNWNFGILCDSLWYFGILCNLCEL